MSGRLQAEIHQNKPFRSLEEEVYLNLLRSADVLLRGVEKTLKSAGLSPAQYNVLRILRGAGKDGLVCREIAERMLTRDPDITRLLDRLEKNGLVVRGRGQRDRRVVKTRITGEGRKLLRTLDAPLDALQRRQLRPLGRRRLQSLVELLEETRAGAESPSAQWNLVRGINRIDCAPLRIHTQRR